MQLDETDTSLENTSGRDVHVIDKKVPVELNGTDKFVNIGVWFLFIVGGVVYTFKKNKARTYFKQLEQDIQQCASEIDNYMEQRVIILQNAAKLVDKAVDLDKDTFVQLAQARSGNAGAGKGGVDPDVQRNQLDAAMNRVSVVLESYPSTLQGHEAIAQAMQQNQVLQAQITAARTKYNNKVNLWNREITTLWAKKYVAAKEGYTTRIPFIASKEMKEKSREVLF